jgi:hypothetical protein
MTQPFALKPGDVVGYQVDDYVVESRTAYTSPRLSWTEWMLNAGDADARVAVALIGPQVYVGRPCFVEGRFGDPTVRVGGAAFDLTTGGRVDASLLYDTGATRFDRAEFWHYRGPGGRLLAARRGHLGEWAFDLEPVDPAMLEVYGA